MKLPQWSEVGWMRAVAATAVIILTAMLASLNISGAWIGSNGNIPFTGTILGAEILAACCLVLIIAAPTWPRKLVGALVFAVLVWVCIENGKLSVERSFKDVFVGDYSALTEKAKVAAAAAETLKTSTPEDQKALKQERAELLVEQKLMAAPASDRKAVAAAQTTLKAQGLYVRAIDGIQGEDTQAAMLSRGRAIGERLAELKTLITDETGAQSAAERKAGEAIDLQAAADKVMGGAFWMIMLLIGLEGARSFGLWCYVIWDTKYKREQTIQVDPDVFKDLQAQADELRRRKSNIDEGVDKALNTKKRKKKKQEERDQSLALLKLQDQRSELEKKADADEAQRLAEMKVIDDAIAKLNGQQTDDSDEQDDEPEQTEGPAAPDAPETEDADESQPRAA